ncbi:MAG: hypothetical protein ACK5MW_02420 [Enterococcus sp.]
MNKKHRTLIILITVLTVIHTIFCAYYPWLYGYFNLQDHLAPFLEAVFFSRSAFVCLIAISGFLSIRDKMNRALPFYLIFFLFNLLLPNLFN